MRRYSWSIPLILFSSLNSVRAYEVPVTDTDYSPQVCSGMWGGSSAYINASFDSTSKGQVAMIIYEWGDEEMLGKVTSMIDDTLPKTYVCTTEAAERNFCTTSELGRFILDIPSDKTINDTSIWNAQVDFPTSSPSSNVVSSERSALARKDEPLNPSPEGTLIYDQPIQYFVRKTGYYCVAMVPITRLSNNNEEVSETGPIHTSFTGTVLFQNVFHGKLPATDYPKTNFYFVMFLVYAALGGAWGWLCYRHRDDLLPIQYYISGLVGFLVVEMFATWVYYRYLNAHGRGTTSVVFLIVVAILDAGQNALSFFMLLVISLGLSVVRESLGSTMLKCQGLAAAHFIFGVLYAVGIVELELESTSALVLLLFVIPLAFTLSGFLFWIMYALNGTLAELAARKQRYKFSVFQRLNRILMLTVLNITIFFVVSSLSFSDRLAEDYAANSWKVQWWLLDGWLALSYLAAFVAIAYLWRPTGNNRR